MTPCLCPFCGSETAAVIAVEDIGPWRAVSCSRCDAEGPAEKSEAEAIEAWNRRVPALIPPPPCAIPEGHLGAWWNNATYEREPRPDEVIGASISYVPPNRIEVRAALQWGDGHRVEGRIAPEPPPDPTGYSLLRSEDGAWIARDPRGKMLAGVPDIEVARTAIRDAIAVDQRDGVEWTDEDRTRRMVQTLDTIPDALLRALLRAVERHGTDNIARWLDGMCDEPIPPEPEPVHADEIARAEDSYERRLLRGER